MADITITGLLGRDAEMRFTPSGEAVANFTVADDLSRKNVAGQWETVSTTWWRVSLWGKAAEAMVEHLTKGAKVVVLGTVHERQYDKDGEKRSSFDVKARTVALIPRTTGNAPRTAPAPAVDPWATPASDEPPF